MHRGELAGRVLGEREGEETADRRAVARRECQVGEVRERLRIWIGRAWPYRAPARAETLPVPARPRRLPRAARRHGSTCLPVRTTPPGCQGSSARAPAWHCSVFRRTASRKVRSRQPNRSFAAHASALSSFALRAVQPRRGRGEAQPGEGKGGIERQRAIEVLDRHGPSAGAGSARAGEVCPQGRERGTGEAGELLGLEAGPERQQLACEPIHQIGQAVVRSVHGRLLLRAAGGYIDHGRAQDERSAVPTMLPVKSRPAPSRRASRSTSLQAGHSAPRPMRSTTA